MPASLRVEGLRQLQRELRQLDGGLQDLKDANAAVARLVAGAAARRAPRRTGRLAAAVKGNTAAARARVSVPRVPYGPPVHWGWPDRGIAPQTFLRDAAADTEPVWLPVYVAAVQRLVDKVDGAGRV